MEEKTSVPCIKCGRETVSNAVFCPECLADMEKHPVKPGTPVVLHQKPAAPLRRPPARKVRKPEEQIRSLKHTVTSLWAVIILLAAALCIVTGLWLNQRSAPVDDSLGGDNYQTSQTQTTSQ